MNIGYEKLHYHGEVTDQKCGICKLPISEDHKPMQCPSCLTLFHAYHILEWLENNDDCPVCKMKLRTSEKKAIPNGSYSQKERRIQIGNPDSFDDQTTMNPNSREITIKNPAFNPKLTTTLTRIALTFAGLIASIAILVISIIYIVTQTPAELNQDIATIGIVLVIVSIFFASGVGLFIKGLTTKTEPLDYWENITLKPNKILVSLDNKSTNKQVEKSFEIHEDEISKIELRINSRKQSEHHLLRLYYLVLTITDIKNNTYDFSSITRTRKMIEVHQIQEGLEAFFKNNYPAKISTRSYPKLLFFEKRFLITSLLSLMGYILLMVGIIALKIYV